LTKSETVADAASCLNKAEHDEPVFVLRAHDPLAADAIRHWAFARFITRGDYKDATAVEAMKVAETMDQWRRNRG
jgi:hypothetical protein